MNKIGKIGKVNIKAVARLKEDYHDRGIINCEVRLDGCDNWFLQFAHRHKRIWYRSRPELLSNFNQTVLACNKCHSKIEVSRELTEEVFNRLRGDEDVC